MTKQLAIKEETLGIKTIPPEKINQIVASAGTKSFTAQDILNEIKNDTEYGKQLVGMISNLRMEVAKKTEGT